MSQRHLSAEKLKEIHELAAGWGKIIANRVFGAAGPDETVDFQAMEQVAAVAARGLTEGTLTILMEQRAKTLGSEQPCPDCGRLCPISYEDRSLNIKGGQLALHEPVCHCPDCRRDFFPPPAVPAPGQP